MYKGCMDLTHWILNSLGFLNSLLKSLIQIFLCLLNVTIPPSDSARNLGVIFDSSLTMSDHISSISKSRFLSIRDLRRIRNTIDLTTAKTIATSLIHSEVDYCNSLYLNLSRTQLDRLPLILNSAAREIGRAHV